MPIFDHIVVCAKRPRSLFGISQSPAPVGRLKSPTGLWLRKHPHERSLERNVE